jgi:hypothetical protein
MLGGPNAEIRESPSGLGALINQFMFGAPEGQGIKDYGYYDSETREISLLKPSQPMGAAGTIATGTELGLGALGSLFATAAAPDKGIFSGPVTTGAGFTAGDFLGRVLTREMGLRPKIDVTTGEPNSVLDPYKSLNPLENPAILDIGLPLVGKAGGKLKKFVNRNKMAKHEVAREIEGKAIGGELGLGQTTAQRERASMHRLERELPEAADSGMFTGGTKMDPATRKVIPPETPPKGIRETIERVGELEQDIIRVRNSELDDLFEFAQKYNDSVLDVNKIKGPKSRHIDVTEFQNFIKKLEKTSLTRPEAKAVNKELTQFLSDFKRANGYSPYDRSTYMKFFDQTPKGQMSLRDLADYHQNLRRAERAARRFDDSIKGAGLAGDVSAEALRTNAAILQFTKRAVPEVERFIQGQADEIIKRAKDPDSLGLARLKGVQGQELTRRVREAAGRSIDGNTWLSEPSIGKGDKLPTGLWESVGEPVGKDILESTGIMGALDDYGILPSKQFRYQTRDRAALNNIDEIHRMSKMEVPPLSLGRSMVGGGLTGTGLGALAGALSPYSVLGGMATGAPIGALLPVMDTLSDFYFTKGRGGLSGGPIIQKLLSDFSDPQGPETILQPGTEKKTLM